MRILKRSLLGLLLICIINAGHAQDDLELRDIFYDGEYFLMSEDYEEALSAYLKVYREIPENANLNYRIGLCYLNIEGVKLRSIPHLEKAIENVSENYEESHFNEQNAPVQTYFLLGTAYQINEDFDRAVSCFREYKKYLNIKDVYEIDFIDMQIKSCKNAEQFIKEPVSLSSRNLNGIRVEEGRNSYPVMSGDGNTFIFIHREKFYDAIWMSKKINGSWTEPVNVTPQVESDGDCYPTSLSEDGKTLYLVRKNEFDADIYISHFVENEWLPKEKLPKPINSRFWETHACISNDGNTLYFTSNRKNGLGGLDIYKTTKDRKGKWGDAVNLGPTINTRFNETSPYIIESENIVLYYSSQGLDGLGGFDIYKSVQDESGLWTIPVNMGYPLNTTDDDLFFYPIEDGKKALYSGNLAKSGSGAGIKEIIINPEGFFAENIIRIKGQVKTDDLAELPPNTILLFKDKHTGSTDSLRPDPESGDYLIEVMPGEFELTALARGYEKNIQSIEIPADFQRSSVNINFQLVPDEVSTGEYYAIKNILFDYDSDKLSHEAKLEIERLYKLMVKYPEIFIEVIGHTDSKGSPFYNLKLSKERANSVTQYLVNKGIDPLRFVSKGAGEMDNLALNINPDGSDNPEGRKMNRSVSIKLLSSPGNNIVIEPEPVPDYLKPAHIPTYTILLANAQDPLPNSRFKELNYITQQDVTENFSQGVYLYSIGKFFSRSQAEEVIQTPSFKSFPQAQIVRVNNLTAYSGPSSLIQSSESGNFAIQIYALRKPVTTGHFSDLESVCVIKSTDGFYRVTIGSYDERRDAEIQLERLKSEGYIDAFIVDTGRLLAMEAEDGSQLAAKKGINNYSIQLSALKARVSIDYFRPLKGIIEIEGENEFFKYLYGEFDSLESARLELKKIKAMGYSDAFIRETSSIAAY